MAKRVLAVFCGLLLLGASFARAQSIPLVYGTNADFQGNGQSLRWSELFPLDSPVFTVTNTIQRDRIRFTNDASGGWSLTNVYPGMYRREFHGKFTDTTNFYNFPATNGTVNADDPTYRWGPTNTPNLISIGVGNANYVTLPTNNATSTDGQVLQKSGNGSGNVWRLGTVTGSGIPTLSGTGTNLIVKGSINTNVLVGTGAGVSGDNTSFTGGQTNQGGSNEPYFTNSANTRLVWLDVDSAYGGAWEVGTWAQLARD
jgi:hypothetical protein